MPILSGLWTKNLEYHFVSLTIIFGVCTLGDDARFISVLVVIFFLNFFIDLFIIDFFFYLFLYFFWHFFRIGPTTHRCKFRFGVLLLVDSRRDSPDIEMVSKTWNIFFIFLRVFFMARSTKGSVVVGWCGQMQGPVAWIWYLVCRRVILWTSFGASGLRESLESLLVLIYYILH